MSLFVRDTSPGYDPCLWVLDHMALSEWELSVDLRSEPGTLGWFCVTVPGVATWTVPTGECELLCVQVPEGTAFPEEWEQFRR